MGLPDGSHGPTGSCGTIVVKHSLEKYCSMLGWGATNETGEQSRFPRQVDLSYNSTSDCDCKDRYRLETNVGPNGEDTCRGDSGMLELKFLFRRITILDKYIPFLPINERNRKFLLLCVIGG